MRYDARRPLREDDINLAARGALPSLDLAAPLVVPVAERTSVEITTTTFPRMEHGLRGRLRAEYAPSPR